MLHVINTATGLSDCKLLIILNTRDESDNNFLLLDSREGEESYGEIAYGSEDELLELAASREGFVPGYAYATVWECTFDAWQIHTSNGTIVVSDDYDPDHADLCEEAGIDPEDTESWSCEITELDPIHERLRMGDKVVSAGPGSDVCFLRETKL